MSKVTIRTGGVVVGRKNSTFDLDSTTMILDLARRGYRVFVRGTDSYLYHVISVHMHGEFLVVDHLIHDQPADNDLKSKYGIPDWWSDLQRHLTLLEPELLTITSEEASCPTP